MPLKVKGPENNQAPHPAAEKARRYSDGE